MKEVKSEGQEAKMTAPLPRISWKACVPVSILVLLPVYWQPRVQAGDLSSHIYNAWLAQLIEAGRTEGLEIVRQTTNILFDLMLAGLLRLFGAEIAQRLSVSVAVLVFVWGSFRFVSVAAGRRAWHLLPCIAMFAYGWVFHMGFFNFYLSLGFCFWALSLVWNWEKRGIMWAVPMFVLAYLAHALPVVWTAGLLAYQVLARRATPRVRIYLTGLWLLVMMVIHVAVGQTMVSRWSAQQIKMSTGADQVWVFDGKYYLVLAGLLLVWSLLFLELVRKSGPQQVVSSIPFHLCVIAAAAVFILPTTVLIPGFQHKLVYIAERMSLGVGICVCALLGAAIPKAYERYALVVLSVVFFGFLFRDERILNSLEDRIDDIVSQIPQGQRVISAVEDPTLHVFAVTHMIDRACLLHRCYSYANYEPSTAQFRIRAVAPNRYVTANYEDSWRLQNGTYVVKETDLPLLQLFLDESGGLRVRSLKPGSECGSTTLKALPALFELG
jgi:hypothetical protein